MVPPVNPILFHIGDKLSIHWYGLLIVIGIILGANVGAYLAKRAGKDPEIIWDMLLLVVFLAIIGSRIYHIFSQPAGGAMGWNYYKEHPIEMLYIWQGGLGIYGAIIGGAIGVIIFCAYRHLRPLEWLDYAAPGMAIGQAIGRWGNYVNRELYGPPTTLPWGLQIPFPYRIVPYNDMMQYPESTLFHPTFLYESLGALIVCLILIGVADKYRGRLREGDLLIGYLIGYSVVRFLTEFLRPDAWMMGPIAAAQVFALGFIVAGAIFLVARHRFARRLT
ncbi:MAG TPA: prolipoprotein diacylglyceryl transferase [Anaerolineae bacterium]|nr:prolipoprotein diacylglyceryl transferase [Anaerolineae bacterium]